MSRHHPKGRGALVLAVLACALLFAAAAVAQERMLEYEAEAFEESQMPASKFDHDLHMGEIPDCTVCHHYYEDGQKVEGADSIGMACSDCHSLGGDETNSVPLREAYHVQCAGCHEQQGKGPVACGQCHVKGE
ncbi:acidic tetraheme cytochrome c3 TmcA [Desulfohalovibrio reitneri]|uniref:acidic tetraheme cytochrome c3 TmcA n=1 Tax=Desulfohalovibrio reitneri TaxID=1307759 RepID=UPI0004A717E9|nr:cytochrome c3 family protein [Desulfohalovibrio reitneri]